MASDLLQLACVQVKVRQIAMSTTRSQIESCLDYTVDELFLPEYGPAKKGKGLCGLNVSRQSPHHRTEGALEESN